MMVAGLLFDHYRENLREDLEALNGKYVNDDLGKRQMLHRVTELFQVWVIIVTGDYEHLTFCLRDYPNGSTEVIPSPDDEYSEYVYESFRTRRVPQSRSRVVRGLSESLEWIIDIDSIEW